jgi:uncharacterized membrane protein YhiD involved in acid resistance
MIVYAVIIAIMFLAVGFAIGSYTREISDREIIKVLQEQYFKNSNIKEELIDIKKTINFISEVNNKHNKDVLEEIHIISKNIDNKLDDKIATLIEEAQHIEKNKDKDINHFYG